MAEPTIAETTAKLTQACIYALVHAEPTPFGELRINCNHLYPPTIRALERRGLLNRLTTTLSDKGLAVRAHLQGDQP